MAEIPALQTSRQEGRRQHSGREMRAVIVVVDGVGVAEERRGRRRREKDGRRGGDVQLKAFLVRDGEFERASQPSESNQW